VASSEKVRSRNELHAYVAQTEHDSDDKQHGGGANVRRQSLAVGSSTGSTGSGRDVDSSSWTPDLLNATIISHITCSTTAGVAVTLAISQLQHVYGPHTQWLPGARWVKPIRNVEQHYNGPIFSIWKVVCWRNFNKNFQHTRWPKKATIENETTSVTTHFKKLTT